MENYQPEADLIFTAVKIDMPSMLMDVINSGVDVNLSNEQGFTPLMLAVAYNNVEIINLLIENGADIECRTQQYTPLMFAVQEGKYHVAKLLIEKGANINSSTDEGLTILMVAIRDNHSKIVELLLSYKVDVTLKTREGSTALMIAKQLKNEEIVVMIEKHLGIYEYGIPNELITRLSVMDMSKDNSDDKIHEIKQNIFPFAYKSIQSPKSFKWHRYANSNNSSQALTIDVFGTIKMSKYKDMIINKLCKQIGMQTNSNWDIEFEWNEPNNTLNEPRLTEVDVHIHALGTELIIECKFTEQDCGSCSQPIEIQDGNNKGIIQCNGNYELQSNLVNGIECKCALTGKGIKYWDYIPSMYSQFDRNLEYVPCPFKQGNYQWMRNLCIVEILKQRGLNSKFLIVYVESDMLSISKLVKAKNIFGSYSPKSELYAFISFQELINFGLSVSENDLQENEIWLDLKKHFENKLNKAINR